VPTLALIWARCPASAGQSNASVFSGHAWQLRTRPTPEGFTLVAALPRCDPGCCTPLTCDDREIVFVHFLDRSDLRKHAHFPPHNAIYS
jgi:hypothetical protein